MNMVLAQPGLRSAAPRFRGFTLIELMVSVSVMAVLLMVAVPNLAGFVRTSKLRAAQSELVAAMQLARSEATKRGVSVGLAATAPVAGNEFGAGWKVWVDDNDDGLVTAGETVVRGYPGFASAIVLKLTAGTLPVVFRPTGFAAAAVSFKVCASNDVTKGYTVALQRVGMSDLTEGVACP
jgi:type IV fimbrial biogenesis protein FimT